MEGREFPAELAKTIEAPASLFSGRPRERAADEPYLRFTEVPLFMPDDAFTPETKRLAIGGINWVLDEHLRYGSLPETAAEHPSEHEMFLPRPERDVKEQAVKEAVDKDFDVNDLKRLSELIATLETEIGHMKNDTRRGQLHYLLEAAQALYDYGKSAYRRNNCNQLFGIYNNYYEAFAEFLPQGKTIDGRDELYQPAAVIATGIRMLDHLHQRKQDDGRDTLKSLPPDKRDEVIARMLTNRRNELERWSNDVRLIFINDLSPGVWSSFALSWIDDPEVLLMNEPSSPAPSAEVLQRHSELIKGMEIVIQKVMEGLREKLRSRGVNNVPTREFPEYAGAKNGQQHEVLTPPELIEALRQMLIRLKAQLREVPAQSSPSNEPAVS